MRLIERYSGPSLRNGEPGSLGREAPYSRDETGNTTYIQAPLPRRADPTGRRLLLHEHRT